MYERCAARCQGSHHVNRCLVEGIVHVIPPSKNGVKENDVVAAAMISTPENSLPLNQLDRFVDALQQDCAKVS